MVAKIDYFLGVNQQKLGRTGLFGDADDVGRRSTADLVEESEAFVINAVLHVVGLGRVEFGPSGITIVVHDDIGERAQLKHNQVTTTM